jgi:hypothetical protein
VSTLDAVITGMSFSSTPKSPDRLWGPPVSYSVGMGGGCFSREKQPGHEADHSPVSSPEVKGRSNTAAPTTCLNGLHKDKCIYLYNVYIGLSFYTVFANKLFNCTFIYIYNYVSLYVKYVFQFYYVMFYVLGTVQRRAYGM